MEECGHLFQTSVLLLAILGRVYIKRVLKLGEVSDWPVDRGVVELTGPLAVSGGRGTCNGETDRSEDFSQGFILCRIKLLPVRHVLVDTWMLTVKPVYKL